MGACAPKPASKPADIPSLFNGIGDQAREISKKTVELNEKITKIQPKMEELGTEESLMTNYYKIETLPAELNSFSQPLTELGACSIQLVKKTQAGARACKPIGNLPILLSLMPMEESSKRIITSFKTMGIIFQNIKVDKKAPTIGAPLGDQFLDNSAALAITGGNPARKAAQFVELRGIFEEITISLPIIADKLELVAEQTKDFMKDKSNIIEYQERAAKMGYEMKLVATAINAMHEKAKTVDKVLKEIRNRKLS